MAPVVVLRSSTLEGLGAPRIVILSRPGGRLGPLYCHPEPSGVGEGGVEGEGSGFSRRPRKVGRPLAAA